MTSTRVERGLPAHNHQDIIELVVNANGATLDRRSSKPVQYAISYIKGDVRWTTRWHVNTWRGADCWTGEMAVSLSDVAKAAIEPGATWGLNVCRDRHSRQSFGPRGERFKAPRECSSWAPVYDTVGERPGRWIAVR